MPLTVSVTRTLLRHDVGVDAIALVLMAGALALGASLADALIALMLAFGVPFLLSISPTCIDFRFALYGASVFVSVGLWARRRSSDRWSPAGVDGPRRWTPHPHGLTFVGVRSSGGGSIVYGADGVLLPVFPIRACRRW